VTTRWRVIYTGKIEPSVSADRAIGTLTETLGLTRERASALVLGGTAKVVAQDQDRERADRLAEALRQAGLVAEITPMPEPQPTLSLEPLAHEPCPQCGSSGGLEQGRCTNCGFVVEKRVAASTSEPAASLKRSLAGDAAPARAGRPANAHTRPQGSGVTLGTVLRSLAGLIALAVLAGGVLTGSWSDWGQHQAAPPPTPAWQRPAVAPSGVPWPSWAGYVAGYPQGSTNGYSSVTLDNARGKSDVFVKLYTLGTSRPRAVRTFYVPAYQSFTLSGVSAGRYDLRIRDLKTGDLSRTDPFEITQTIGPDGAGSYSTFTLRTVATAGGSAVRSVPLAESEF